jgi:hypothetical protein
MIFGALTNSIKFMKFEWIAAIILLFAQTSCLQTQKTDGKFHGEKGEVKIIQLNPTHSHAAVAQNVKLEQVDTNVYVYSPEKEELKEYFQQINSCNSRKNNPTNWNLVNYSGPDYLQKMIDERKGNVVVLSGNNKIKIDYIEKSIDAGFNVFSDKPMVINKSGFNRLKDIYPIAPRPWSSWRHGPRETRRATPAAARTSFARGRRRCLLPRPGCWSTPRSISPPSSA